MAGKTPVEVTAEKLTGRSVEDIRNSTLEEIRQIAERKTGRRFRIEHVERVAGRGNILGDRIIGSDEVERLFEEAMNVE